MYDIVKEIWRNPGAQYSPYPIWQWQEDDSAEKLIERMDLFHRKGIDGFIISMPECGLNDNIADTLSSVLEAAKKRFMLMFIRDSFAAVETEIVSKEPLACERVLLLKPTADRRLGDEVLMNVFVKKENGLLTDVKLGADDGYEQCDIILGYGDKSRIDILNPYSAENIISGTLEGYNSKLHDYFGSTILGFNMVQRENASDKILWSYGMDEEWMMSGGDISQLVSLLTEPKVKKQRREAEFIYNNMLRKRISASFLSPIAKWCTEHGVGLTGSMFGDIADIAYSSQFDVPFGGVRYDSDEKLPLKLKAISDTARHRGVARCAAELFNGVNSVSPDEFMCEINSALSCSGSMIIPGKCTEAMAEESPLWCEYKKASLYTKRMSWLNSAGSNNPVCAVLCSDDYIPENPVEKLYEAGYPFNYLTIDNLMNKAHIHDGEIHIDRYEYKILLIDTRLRLSAEIVEKIGRFVTENGLLYRGTDFAAFLDKHVKHDVRFIHDNHADNTVFLNMTKSGCPFCAVINNGDEGVHGKIAVPYNYSADRFDPFSGKTYEMYAEMTDNGFEYDVYVPEHSSLVLGFNPDSLVRIKKEDDDELKLAEIVSVRGSECTFTVRDDTSKVLFSSENVNGVVSVSINGKEAGRLIFKPYVLDITEFTHSGENTIALSLCGNEVIKDGGVCSKSKIALYHKREK